MSSDTLRGVKVVVKDAQGHLVGTGDTITINIVHGPPPTGYPITGEFEFVNIDLDLEAKDLELNIRTTDNDGKITQLTIQEVEIIKNGFLAETLEACVQYEFAAKKIIPWAEISDSPDKKVKDDHDGMVFNPYTGRWSWL